MAGTMGISGDKSRGCEEHDPSVGTEMVHLEGSLLEDERLAFFSKIWKDKDLHDFTLSARGQEFRVHKFMLRAHSSYFDVTSGRLNHFRATVDLDPEVLQCILKFLYEGKIKVCTDRIQELADAADYLGVSTLKNQCHSAQLSNVEITPDNCLDIWMAACEVHDKARAAKAQGVALENFGLIQHSAQFTQLPVKYVLDLLSQPALRVHSVDEKLTAAMSWLSSDVSSKKGSVMQLLKYLPLELMQGWHLRQVMNIPVVRNDSTAHQTLLKALEGQQAEPQDTYFITVGFQAYDGETQLPPSKEIWGIKLSGEMKARSFGEIQASDIRIGVAVSTQGSDMYIGGLGKDWTELWKYNIKTGKQSKVGRFLTGREYHGMCFKNGLLYIVGGRDRNGKEVDTIEAFNPNGIFSTCFPIGTLQSSDLPGGCGSVYCCDIRHESQILLYGALAGRYHTLQKFSLTSNIVVDTFTVTRVSGGSAYKVLAVNESTFLLFAYDYTAVYFLNQPGDINYCEKYTIPNPWCSIVLGPDKKHVLVLGGLSTSSHVFRASVQDIIHNAGNGWEKLNVPWPLGKCCFNGYDTINM